MLWTICLILLVLWALGMVTSTTMGGLIHVLLVVAIVVVLIQPHPGAKSRLTSSTASASSAEAGANGETGALGESWSFPPAPRSPSAG